MYWMAVPNAGPGRMKKMVDRARFELATSSMPRRRSSSLRPLSEVTTGLIYRPMCTGCAIRYAEWNG